MSAITAATVAEDVADQLASVVGSEHVRLDAGARTAFAGDATPLHRALPDAIVFPADTAEVAAVLRIADERRIPVVPRGAGTNLSAGVVPHRGGIVLVLT